MFRLKLLGGLALESDSEMLPASAHQRRRLALLVVLARAGGRGASRDRLLALLWPESTQESARHALDQLLYLTRRDLGRDVISSETGQLRLDAGVVWSDAARFEAHLQQGEWEAAAGLYAGPFLDGVHLGGSLELERWVDAERARLAERFVGALERLAHSARERGDREAAVSWARRRVAAEPLGARGALGLMQALADAGDPAGALRYFHTYRTLLREELETEPGTEVLALAERLTREPERRPPGDPGTNPPSPDGERSPGGPADEPPTGSHPLPGPDPAPAAAEGSGPAPPVRPLWLGRRSRRAALVASLAGAAAVAGAIVLADAHTPAAHPAPPAARSTAAGTRTPDPAAHSLYLRGRIAWNRRSREGLQEAVVLFRQATERDPTYAEAYAGLADAYVILGYLGYVPGDATFPKGKAAALQALALDPTVGEAHAALGVALQWEKRWTEAERAFVRAIEYAPTYATGHQWYALLLTILGRREEAVVHGRHAARLDPLSVQVHNTYGIMLYHAGALDSALHVYERVVTNEPDTAWVRQNPWVLSNFGKVAAAAGRHRDAVRLIERAAQAVPRHPRPLHALAAAHLAAGDSSRARAVFDGADPEHPHYAVYRALLHAQLGELDAAFAWLDRVEEWGPVVLLPLGGDPVLDPLRADPRYAALRRRLGLPAPR